MAEGFVFAYIGLTFFSYKTFNWSPDLIIAMAVIVLLGSFVALMGSACFSYTCCSARKREERRRLSCGELMFSWYANLSRGAIAFGLVLKMSPDLPNRDVIVTTCLALVVLSTVVYGSTVGLFKCCLPYDDQDSLSNKSLMARIAEASDESESGSEGKTSSINVPLLHYNE